MLNFLTVLIMLAVAYAYFREGVFTAAIMFINTFLSGLVAFNFWEPLAGLLEGPFSGSFLRGYEDMLCLITLFCGTLGALRIVCNMIVNIHFEYPEVIQRAGGVLFGLATGYLVAGFFVCALQTLPWHENFMSFEFTMNPEAQQGMRRLIPPDRVWLALMYRAGAFPFATSDEDARSQDTGSAFERAYNRHFTFDKFGTFELRYARYRRYGDRRDPDQYQGQLAEELRGPGK